MLRYLTEVLDQRRFEFIAESAAPAMVDPTRPGQGPAALEAHASPREASPPCAR